MPAGATLAAVALVGALVGFGGSQVIDHSPSLAGSLAGVTRLLRSGSAPVPVASSSSSRSADGTAPAASAPSANPATGNPSPGRSRAPGASRNPNGNPAAAGNPAPAGQPAAAAGQPASSQDQAAIQQAIQSIDDAQASAVSNNDLSGLATDATAEFAQQQQSVTQDLLDNGVTSIKLDNIEWGPVTVDGTTATATAYETWTTTYSDSTTDQSRDRNVYTLLQQNGSWVVQADDHPDAAAFPGGLQSIPGIPSNLLPPGFPDPFQDQAPHSQPGTGNSTTAPLQVQP